MGFCSVKVYDWAGHYREVDFNKTANGVVTFFHPVALFGNAEMDIQRQLDNFALLPDDREQACTGVRTSCHRNQHVSSVSGR